MTKKIKSFPTRFFKNPPEGTGHHQKRIESKNQHHFENPTFKDVQLCPLSQNYSLTLKADISTLSFLSSDKKRCTRICNVSYRSWKKTKCLFPPSELTYNFGLKGKVVHLKKLVFQSGVGFSIWFNLDLSQPFCSWELLVDFWRILSGNFLFFW